MCTPSGLAKFLLGLVNSVLFLAGLAMFGVSLLFRTHPEISQKWLADMLDRLQGAAQAAGVKLDTHAFTAADVLASFTVALMALGLLLAAVAVLGLVGLKYSLRPLLVVYFIVTLVLFLAQLTIVLMAVIDRSTFDKAVKPGLQTTIDANFVSFASNDPSSQIWNAIMIHLECCGVDGYQDFANASSWNRTSPDGAAAPLATPLACCKNVTANAACARNPTPQNSNYQKGCYGEIWDLILHHSGIATYVAVGVLAAQAVLLLLTYISMKSMVNKVGAIV